jgi:hypothetical protein
MARQGGVHNLEAGNSNIFEYESSEDKVEVVGVGVEDGHGCFAEDGASRSSKRTANVGLGHGNCILA